MNAPTAAAVADPTSAIPQAAADAGTAAIRVDPAAAGLAALPAAVVTPLRSGLDPALLAKTWYEIEWKKLGVDQRAAVLHLTPLVKDMLDAWFNGAQQAADLFKSDLLTKPGSSNVALAGNLLWVVAGFIPGVAAEYKLASFVPANITSAVLQTGGAVAGTYGSTSGTDASGQVVVDVKTSVNNLHDKLVDVEDVLALSIAKTVGFDKVAPGVADGDVHALIWSTLFAAPSNPSDYTNAARDSMSAFLQAADQRAHALLDQYSKAWWASLTPIVGDRASSLMETVLASMVTSDSGGNVTYYRFHADRWNSFTNSAPIKLYAQQDLRDGDTVTAGPGVMDPALALSPDGPDRRAVQLIQRAISETKR